MLKPNIDLTANEIFSLRRADIGIPIWKLLSGKFPWQKNIMTSIETGIDLGSLRFEGILTGSRKQREYKKQYIEIESGNTCNCCGKSLKIIPWDRTYSLCRKCQKDMEENYGNKKKYPWAIDTGMRAERSRISLRW